ncbi:MAG: phospholipase D-like domain-containing protein [Isosphaeraceae bacterium]
MSPREILRQTLEDRHLTRPERQGLDALLAAGDGQPDPRRLDTWRAEAFAVAAEAVGDGPAAEVFDWLEDVVRALQPRGRREPKAECYFSPIDDCARAIVRRIEGAQHALDVCVFTITDDRLADALIAAHARGVAVRVVTDNEKADDFGSDVDRLASAGLAVRVDRSPFHMHHKFAIVDGATLLNGSYNWTRGASRDNLENLVITDDPRLVGPFAGQFGRLWASLA